MKTKKTCTHIPIAAVDNHNRIFDVICQRCFIPMTKDEHKIYFADKPELVIREIDYNNPGDPADVEVSRIDKVDKK